MRWFEKIEVINTFETDSTRYYLLFSCVVLNLKLKRAGNASPDTGRRYHGLLAVEEYPWPFPCL